jgi:glucose dehydrogenase
MIVWGFLLFFLALSLYLFGDSIMFLLISFGVLASGELFKREKQAAIFLYFAVFIVIYIFAFTDATEDRIFTRVVVPTLMGIISLLLSIRKNLS